MLEGCVEVALGVVVALLIDSEVPQGCVAADQLQCVLQPYAQSLSPRLSGQEGQEVEGVCLGGVEAGAQLGLVPVCVVGVDSLQYTCSARSVHIQYTYIQHE